MICLKYQGERKALVMRNRRHRSGLGIQSYANNSNVNITNVTNITKVSNFMVSGTSGTHGRLPKSCMHKKGRRNELYGGRERRPPKLQRFCASGGLLDHDVVAGMSEGELCEEAVKVIGHNARGLARDVSDIGGGLCRAAGCVVGGLFGVLEAFVDAWE
jgi:hypothetical protein